MGSSASTIARLAAEDDESHESDSVDGFQLIHAQTPSDPDHDRCSHANASVMVKPTAYSERTESSFELTSRLPHQSIQLIRSTKAHELGAIDPSFHRHQICHCCKNAQGTITRDIIHTDFAMVRVRFCSLCLEKRGHEFMALVRTMKQPAKTTCSGCGQEKRMKDFHKRQQILRPWEELPDEPHLCLACLPRGFEHDEDAVVPLKLTCVDCGHEKTRAGFVRSLKELALSLNDDYCRMEKWMQNSATALVCDGCLVVAAHAAQRLLCGTCKNRFSRVKFSAEQRAIAKEEDENPGHLGREPVYTCSSCVSRGPLLSLQQRARDYSMNLQVEFAMQSARRFIFDHREVQQTLHSG